MAKNQHTPKEFVFKNSYEECQSSKSESRKKCFYQKMVSQIDILKWKFLFKKFGWFLRSKIEFESTILALFDKP